MDNSSCENQAVLCDNIKEISSKQDWTKRGLFSLEKNYIYVGANNVLRMDVFMMPTAKRIFFGRR